MKSPHETIEVGVPIAVVQLPGFFDLPQPASGLMRFAHSNGSGRFSRGNQHVADLLCRGGIATLLFDLLIAEEPEIDQFTAKLRVDISLRVERRVRGIDWAVADQRTSKLRRGRFGASTGDSAALAAAAQQRRARSRVALRSRAEGVLTSPAIHCLRSSSQPRLLCAA
jgi:putative phosphoribosyl transferase